MKNLQQLSEKSLLMKILAAFKTNQHGKIAPPVAVQFEEYFTQDSVTPQNKRCQLTSEGKLHSKHVRFVSKI